MSKSLYSKSQFEQDSAKADERQGKHFYRENAEERKEINRLPLA